jgi:hypothetical protein
MAFRVYKISLKSRPAFKETSPLGGSFLSVETNYAMAKFIHEVAA